MLFENIFEYVDIWLCFSYFSISKLGGTEYDPLVWIRLNLVWIKWYFFSLS